MVTRLGRSNTVTDDQNRDAAHTFRYEQDSAGVTRFHVHLSIRICFSESSNYKAILKSCETDRDRRLKTTFTLQLLIQPHDSPSA